MTRTEKQDYRDRKPGLGGRQGAGGLQHGDKGPEPTPHLLPEHSEDAESSTGKPEQPDHRKRGTHSDDDH